MAEETTDIPAIPEKIELKGDHKRRNSTGTLSISTSGVKILPRYLSVSLGSCHDFCKYGIIEHVHEKKKRSHLPKRITARPGEGIDQVKDVILEERDKISAINRKPFPDSKSQTTSTHKVAKRFSLPGNTMDVSTKHVADLSPERMKTKPSSNSIPRDRCSRWYSEISMSKGVGVVQESPVGGSRSRGNTTIDTSKEMKMPELRKKKDLVPPTVSVSQRTSVKREWSTKSGTFRGPNKVSLVNNQNGVRKSESKQPIDKKVPEKTLYVIETKPDKPIGNGPNGNDNTTHSSLSLSPSSDDKKSECGRNGMHSSASPPSLEKKELRRTRNGSHTTQSSSSSSLYFSKKSVGRTQNGNHNAPPSSSSLSLLSSSSHGSDQSTEGSGFKMENQIPNRKVECTIRPKRVENVNLEDKVGSPQKLNFRRGKVVDVLFNNTSPRKLRFNQRRVLGENQNGKADSEPRSLMKLDAIDEVNGSKTEPLKVVLRHQEVEGKKCGQNLFNNVIEETASKLVKARKSKVRALVDAFETVISLQDTKFAASTNAS